MCRVAVRSEDGDLVAKRLKTYGGVDYEALGAANAEVGVEEDDALRHLGEKGAHGRV